MKGEIFFFFVLISLSLETNQDSILRDIITDILTSVSERNRFVKIINLTARIMDGWYRPGTNATKVELHTLTSGGKVKKDNLVLDGFPFSEFGERLQNETGLLKNQLAFFQEVAPALENLGIEFDDRSEKIWVGALGYKQNIIVLEDIMADSNYTRPDKDKGLDLPHSELAVITLAKFHAMTAVLAERGMIYLKHFDKSIFERNQHKIRNYYQIFFNYLAEAITQNWGPEWNKTAAMIQEKAETVTSRMLEMYRRNDSTFNVLNNGGFILSNILFRYGISDVYVSKIPIAMKMEPSFDSFYNSPAFDLQKFINTSPNLHVMTAQKDHLVQMYYKALSRYLDRFGFNGTRSPKPTLEGIKEEMKRTEFLGLIFAANELCYAYLDPEEIVDIVNVVEKSWDHNEVYIDRKCLYGKKYSEMMKVILKKYFQ